MKKIGVAGLQREQIKKTIEATAPGFSFTTTWKRQ